LDVVRDTILATVGVMKETAPSGAVRISKNPVHLNDYEVSFFFGTDFPSWTLRVYDAVGNRLVTRAGTARKVSWNLRTPGGAAVASGTYRVVVLLKDEHGKRFYWTSVLGIQK
ncbi:MAG: hypothetical protein ACQEQV_08695, partial [Fibrobacterota bacterium]